MNSPYKLFVIYHKPSDLIATDIYQPIAVGKDKNSFPELYLKDDVGDNIADKNVRYNELTAIYWVYKHLDEFKDVQYIGFTHYRRLFVFSGVRKRAYVKKNINKEMIRLSNELLSNIFYVYDFIVPFPNHYKSVRHHYEKSHNTKDIDILLNIIKEKEPKYYEAATKYIEGKDEYSYNMFVFKVDDFIEYARFIFNILDTFEKEVDEESRLYVSERLTGIYITYLLANKKKALHLPIYHIRKKSLKGMKKNEGRGFFYRFKNFILYLMPRWLEQYLRNKKAM